MSDVTYRLMHRDDAANVSALVLSVFDAYIAPEYTPQGISEFRKYAEASALANRAGRDHFVVMATTATMATEQDTLVAMIEMREHNHVSLLFVGKAFQRQGLSRALLDQAIAHSRGQGARPDRLTVNSSRYGVPAYEALGFRQTGPERSVNDILFTPMARRLEEREASTSQTSPD